MRSGRRVGCWWSGGRAGRRAGGRTELIPPSRPPALPPVEDRHFADLPDLIPPGDLLVLNTTRVRPARLLGTRPSGAPAEVLLLHPGADDSWVAMGKPGSALRPGKRIFLGEGMAVETIEVLDEGYRLVRFVGGTAEEAMARLGRMPLPPYITAGRGPQRSGAVPDGLRRAGRQRRRADGGAPFHPGAPGPTRAHGRCGSRASTSKSGLAPSGRSR